MCWSLVRLVSKITPGLGSLMEVRLGVTNKSNLECICLLPSTISLVLLGLNNKVLGTPSAYSMQVIS